MSEFSEPKLESLLGLGQEIARKLREKNENISVMESSAGGLISTSLLAVSGASYFFRGGTCLLYTSDAADE